MRGVLTALLALLAPGVASAQSPTLDLAAERARSAWLAGDLRGLLGPSDRLLIELPGAAPSAPVERAQALALLGRFLAHVEEVSVEVRAAREVDVGRGYVELRRRFRVAGSQTIRSETVLLGFRQTRAGWSLAELRVGG